MKKTPLLLLSILGYLTVHCQNVGIGTTTPKASLHVNMGAVVFTSPSIVGLSGPPPVSGEGNRMMWYPAKAAFRAGRASADEWDQPNVGPYSTAFGADCISNGFASFAAGGNTNANGNYSISVGQGTSATGFASSALGQSNYAYATASTALGRQTRVNGYASLVAGVYNDPILSSPQTELTAETPLFMIGNGDNNTTRSNAMVVLKNGNVRIGNNGSPTNRLHITGGNAASLGANAGFITIGDIGNTNMVFDQDDIQVRADGSASHIYLQKQGGNVMIGPPGQGDPMVIIGPTHKLSVNGNASKTGSTTWATWSDMRLKQHIQPYTDGLSSLLKINPVWYQYTPASGFDAETKFVGVLAQQLQQISPYMVSKTIGSKTPDGDGYLSVDNGAMTYMLINAVKEQQQIIDGQAKRLKTMLQRIEALENRKL